MRLDVDVEVVVVEYLSCALQVYVHMYCRPWSPAELCVKHMVQAIDQFETRHKAGGTYPDGLVLFSFSKSLNIINNSLDCIDIY